MTADGTALPEAFTRTIVSLLGDDAGAAWLRALPQTIVALASHWDLQVGPALDLSHHYVALARRADGTPAVLKLGPPSDWGCAASPRPCACWTAGVRCGSWTPTSSAARCCWSAASPAHP